MKKPKTKMPEDLKKKCHAAIHTATVAAAAGGAVPIPMADTIPISTAQIAMVVALGKVFDVTISQSVAKSMTGILVGRQVGRTVVSTALKSIPGIGTLAGGAISSATAAFITETMGWMIADDFYRMSQGENPEDLIEVVDILQSVFEKH